MENHTFKSVAFGGFDKQDVIQYIEQSAKEASTVQEKLQHENADLRAERDHLSSRTESLEKQLESLTAERNSLAAKLEQETAARQALESVKSDLERLTAEMEKLRPDAEAYAQFRASIGSIECEARERAASLEAATNAQLRKTVDLFRAQYQTLMSTFESTASHVTSELRKIEVNLTQLPRAMDQAGTELNELAAQLDASKRETQP